MEGWPRRRREGERREGRERSERGGGWKQEVRQVMRGRDKEEGEVGGRGAR